MGVTRGENRGIHTGAIEVKSRYIQFRCPDSLFFLYIHALKNQSSWYSYVDFHSPLCSQGRNHVQFRHGVEPRMQ
jgi:hypothetical protein